MTEVLEKVEGLLLQGLRKRFGELEVLKGISLEVKKGELFTLLGPSGCGKTTLLRLVGGFELPDAGRIVLSGRDLTGLPAHRRPVNTVFQNYALFPHLTVYENVAFGLRSRRFPEAVIRSKVEYALGLLRLESLVHRYPHQLSGGQKQRVALARALVNEPEVLLLDEPMSALDAKLRAEVQVELRNLQRRLGATFILVTHDQEEAMAVSDRIGVMEGGVLLQVGTPDEVYERPRTRFVAEFLGVANLILARKVGEGAETPLGVLPVKVPWNEGFLALRPERVEIHEVPVPGSLPARVRQVIYRGAYLEAFLEALGQVPLRARTSLRLEVGQEVFVRLPLEGLVVLDG
ncbi:Fe3+/spermidine/putrescine ABC transporter ATP-binding protein [Thermus scotoductus]|uniref:Fe3+/spermidine/putrescine ABC transporter ATP-binding protein n=1 Tax=Thermus scotoductus TaxID=37636 RepID=A0A430SDD7_THESC|nr:ABC transporter ATP-binding protein [Thermus scotoductus]RTG96571.1 Fe3+/spermidine/putrescine ABC transporter ATP-binding protein [Thermus scotoductus]RTH11276.1 Fe3+/spermidine/putrescine ABC transporter ATP-binding protein [Thermus scotoductus]RTH12779.1 Fe3+/spermidine/putrescine ABC transporter ATP-binding protein [Thermus scotoductus]RTH13808.1 Fe3+/spermidine/putrescine ABC transporter ATP-binding protein [Thermus scotoductus]RTH19632.1 Fe3+/spermidine/putrescine ABC transporter ATP-